MYMSKLSFSIKKNFPFFYQNADKDCALACIKMLASYYKKEHLLNCLSQQAHNKKTFWSVNDILSALRTLGMNPRPVRLELDEINSLSIPSVLHWNMNHFVLLVGKKKNKLIIHDPEKGIRHLSLKELSSSFTGVAVEVYNDKIISEKKTSIKDNKVMHYFFMAISLGRKNFIYLFILILLSEIISITLPQITQLVLDNVIINSDYQLLLTAVTFYLFLHVINTGILATRDWLIIWLNANINAQWGINFYNRLVLLKRNYFSSRSTGDILSRFSSLEYIRNVIISKTTTSLLDFFMAIGSLIIMLTYSLNLTFIVIFSTGIYFLLKILYFGSVKHFNLGTIRIKAQQQSSLIEAVKYNQTIKLYFDEYMSAGKYVGELIEGVNVKTQIDILNIIFSASNRILTALKNICILYFGGVFVIKTSFTIGMLVAFITYSEQFSRRVTSLIDFFVQIGITRLHVSRVSDISDADYETISADMPKRISSPLQVEFNNVSVKHPDKQINILNRINFKIMPGETVILKGISGCGKTTLLNAILGLIDVSSGHISITENGMKKSCIDARKMTGAVLQGDSLLNGTVIYNITFNDSSPSRDVIDLTKMIGVHDVIKSLPMGYHTQISDSDHILSAGQKQKILLARAMYRKPQLLILDEATSNLDIDSEYQISQAILSLNCTKIIVSHKEKSFFMADKVITIKNGMIVNIHELIKNQHL
ncbi:peptidase domain-containing ABC transporter (plasmid) [Escherichia albertii]|uniref:peptidase domain-containing ABC transporter n=1 Tax=Escherichia albertii TaxID=208962 RepID=UPI000F5E6D43|nr:peptidase domain-containing ABC transporter [Escherichia albertii]QSZ87520.1 peptidase domain-containing ABC transporter [Escherichia albertii]QSZ91900.1 peptidase domain-containing ABC transporter [Escherichia albertii]QSZ96316.1 peptidase domain-containing ABC transporter [Escherichia albertii]QTA05103.1 peptidase domain-containing ABC transporter [Escherichia albertii]WKU78488.1 peptidase domain-containing ABC transporter [Escherichia albertii]